MKLSDYLIKKDWVRRRYSSSNSKPVPGGCGTIKRQMRKPSCMNYTLDQDVFMSELHSSSHIVYDCNYRSMRRKFKWDETKLKNVEDGFEDVTRTSVSWQEAIRGNKTAICGGNTIWIGNEGSDPNKVAKVKSYCNTLNLQSALLSHFYSIFGVADGALYFYKDGKDIYWECFSYENGDNCSEVRDYEYPDRKMGVRYFEYEGKDAVELYRDESVEFYINVAGDALEFYKIFGRPINGSTTEDGYTLVSSVKHNLGINPFIYFRANDVPWGGVQFNIQDFEKLLSDCGENIKYYAYQILFLSGGAVGLPNSNFGGKVIGSKTKDGDAKILEPADASNTLTIGLKETFNAICDGSKSVFIKPENLKGQNDSGAYIANLYWPEIQWATIFYSQYHKCMIKILDVIKALVGSIEGERNEYKSLKLSYMFEPFIPKNKLEQSQILQNGVQAKFISIETAAEESDIANPMEFNRLKAQREEEIKQETKLSKQTKPKEIIQTEK
ncbi:MAG: phage portal protein [Bacteroidaceae bacterium]